jgi:uncharacterized protein HemY
MEPDSAPAHVAMARFLLRHGDNAAAQHHLAEAHRLNPNDQSVNDRLSQPPAGRMAAKNARPSP